MQSTFCSGATEFLSKVGHLLVSNSARLCFFRGCGIISA